MLFGILKNLLKEGIPSTERSTQIKPGSKGAPTTPVAALAEKNWRRTLELKPNFAEAHNYLGVALKDNTRLDEAEAAFRSAVNLQQGNVVAHYNLGVVLAETNRPLEAEKMYRRALQLLPEFVEAHNNLGIILLKTKRLVEAEAAFRRALELNPDYADAKKNLVIAHAEIERFAELEAGCRHTLELTPNSATAYIELGNLLKGTQRLAEAEAAFRSAIKVQGDNVAAFQSLGDLLAETRRPWEAEDAYRNALKLQPSFAKAHSNLGLVLLHTKRLAEAESACRTALKFEPTSVEALNNLGVVLIDTKRLTEAEAAFRQAVLNQPDHEAANINLGLVLKEIRCLSDDEAACRIAVDLQPNGAMPHYKLGQALLALGKLDEAIASFTRVLVLEPDYANAHNNLGVAFGRQKRVEEAIACYLKAISIKPDFVNAMANLGAAYFVKGDLQQAAKWNQAALAIEPSHADANQSMALILLQTGHRDEAKQQLDRWSVRQVISIEYATDPIRTVLILWTSKIGNVPQRATEFLFPADVNTRVNWVIESADDDQTDNLPNYDLVFNAMGDPDLSGEASGPVKRFTEVCAKPLLNHPDRVARTARNKLPTLLDGINNIVVPPVWRFANCTEWDESVVQLPMIVRPVESHGGTGLKLARTATELAQCRAMQDGAVYLSPFKDFRSADSWFRKYRVIFVDRKPYPYHLAISQNWIVHYYTADMESCPWKLEEEKEFLREPEGVLGSLGAQAIQAIGERIDLEYAGIDFSILPDKRILVFEANPTMLVHAEDIGGPTEHKNEYIFRIQDGFREMLKRLSR